MLGAAKEPREAVSRSGLAVPSQLQAPRVLRSFLRSFPLKTLHILAVSYAAPIPDNLFLSLPIIPGLPVVAVTSLL